MDKSQVFRADATNVRNVVDVFNDMGNHFTETSTDLLALDTKIIMADEVIRSVKTAEDFGKKQYKAFIEESMVQMTKPFHDTIPKNNYALFKSGQQKTSSKSKSKISSMKSDLQLLLFMHTISGYDTVSSFSGIGKKTVWDVWKSLPNLTPLFSQLSETPDEITESDMETIERFVVLLFSCTSPIVTVSSVRKNFSLMGIES